MDAFFAAVEQRDRPELRGKPVIVGADPKGGRGRGVVSTASYEARRFGVGSAMPISEAWRRCPQGVYVHPDMGKYARESERIMEVFHRFTDLVEPVSIDEAFLDVTGSARAMGTGRRDRAEAEGGDPGGDRSSPPRSASRPRSSWPRSPPTCRSRTASWSSRPGTEAAFLAPLPVRRLWGVGPKMEETLAKLGRRDDRGPGRARPRAPRAAPRDARPRPAAPRARRGRPGGVGGVGRGEEPGAGAHLRPGHRRRRRGCGRRCSRWRTGSPAGCAPTACGPAR